MVISPYHSILSYTIDIKKSIRKFFLWEFFPDSFFDGIHQHYTTAFSNCKRLSSGKRPVSRFLAKWQLWVPVANSIFISKKKKSIYICNAVCYYVCGEDWEFRQNAVVFFGESAQNCVLPFPALQDFSQQPVSAAGLKYKDGSLVSRAAPMRPGNPWVIYFKSIYGG